MGLAVLGPVRLDGPDGPVAIEGRKTRQVLTLLALAAPGRGRSTRSPAPCGTSRRRPPSRRSRRTCPGSVPLSPPRIRRSARSRAAARATGWSPDQAPSTYWRSRTCADGPGSARWPETTRPRRRCSARPARPGAATPSCRPPRPATPRPTGWPRSGCCSSRTISSRCSQPAAPPRRSAPWPPSPQNTRCGNGPGSCGSARCTWPAARPTPSTHTGRCTGTCATRWESIPAPRCRRCTARSSRRPCRDRGKCGSVPSRSWPPSPPTSRTTPRRAGSTWRTDGSALDPRRCCS